MEFFLFVCCCCRCCDLYVFGWHSKALVTPTGEFNFIHAIVKRLLSKLIHLSCPADAVEDNDDLYTRRRLRRLCSVSLVGWQKRKKRKIEDKMKRTTKQTIQHKIMKIIMISIGDD